MCVYKFSFLVMLVLTLDHTYGMSRAQLKKTMSIMKNQCMTKVGVGEEKIGKIEQGVFIPEKNVMCYMACVYKNMQVIKNERLVKEMVLKQVDILYPADLKESVKQAVENCIDVQDKYADPCEGIFYSVKCLYDHDPENFIFA